MFLQVYSAVPEIIYKRLTRWFQVVNNFFYKGNESEQLAKNKIISKYFARKQSINNTDDNIFHECIINA